jgi:uncharacterized repeat protein (TIGR01451 family)/fimbrial isopeptide formation D2 family protein
VQGSRQRLWIAIITTASLFAILLAMTQAVQAGNPPQSPVQAAAQTSVFHTDAAVTNLALTKLASTTYPTAGQRITYTLTVANTFTDTAMTGALVSDTLPAGLSLAGPVTLDPPGAGTAGGAPPLLAYNLTISPGQSVDVTFPVTVAEGLPATTVITNTATITSNEVLTPVVAQHSLFLAGVLYVDAGATGTGAGSSWANAFATVQDALAVATGGDEIWVAEDVYYPDEGAGQTDDVRTSTFALQNAVALYGGFVGTETLRTQRDWSAHVTILSGDIDGNDANTDGNDIAETTSDIVGSNAYHVVTGSGTNATAILDGFTVTAGYANGESPHSYGGGIFNYNSGSPQLANLTIIGNYADWYGGGMLNYQGSSPALSNVVLSSNTANSGAGGMYNYTSNPTLSNVTFRSNQAVYEGGGGMYNYDSSPQVTNALFIGNSARRHGGGVTNGPSGNGRFVNVAFYGNYVGGSTWDGAGGGMFNYNGSTPQVVNATFAGNYASFHGGGLADFYGGNDATLTNCILWGNAAGTAGAQAYLDTGDAATFNTSLVQGGCPAGATCNAPFLTDDPRFLAPIAASSAPTTTGSYRLQAGSPAIDAGDSSAVTGVTTDLDGEARILGGGVDLGAYEFAGLALTKRASTPNPAAGQRFTYTLTAVNASTLVEVSGALISDTLPTGLSLAGPITLDPPGAGTVGSAPPVLAHNLGISAEQSVTVTFAVTVAEGLPATAVITNAATITSNEVLTPVVAQQSIFLAGLIYVDADAAGASTGLSWTDAFTNVQDGLAAATSGDEIWVAEGVYYPDEGTGQINDDRASTFALQNGVALYGGFAGTESKRDARDPHAHVTVLSGDVDHETTPDTNADGNEIAETWSDIQGNNAYHVVTSSGTGDTTVLDGFTITAGYANGSDPHDEGGGMLNNAGSPQLADVTFSGNQANRGGGMLNSAGSPQLTDVRFRGNQAVYDGGGMANGYDSSPTLTNVAFSGNQAGRNGGGIYNYDSTGALTNVAFYGNRAVQDGGGMANYEGDHPQLVNVTFGGNQAGEDGGGMFNDDGYYGDSPTLFNCILWGNSSPQMVNEESIPTLSHSLVQGGCPGSATCDSPPITDDPQFVAPVPAGAAPTTSGDYRLQGGSPAINAGDSAALPGSTTTDLDGEPRVLGEEVDLGAYEFSGLALTKRASTSYPAAGQRFTYTLTAINAFTATEMSGALISDTLPAGLSLAGPVVLGPPGAGTVGSTLPLLAYDLTINAGQSVTVTFPVTVAEGLPATAIITNTATITSNEVLTPAVATQPIFLAGLIYVDADAAGASTGLSWTDAFTNVQDGLAAATSGDDIWVAEGIYYPDEGAGQANDDRASTFALKRGVALYGGFVGTESKRDARDPHAHVTVLSGDVDHETTPDTNTDGNGIAETWADVQGNNTYHVVTSLGLDATAVLDGFTITAGKADGSYPHHDGGGGLRNYQGSPRLANLTFSGNQASNDGGGMVNWDNGDPILTDVRFSGNRADYGGGFFNDSSNATLTGVIFSGNQADRGGGMYNASWEDVYLTNVAFYGNHAATDGGGMYTNGWPRLVNVTFGGNQADRGGGIYNYNSSPRLYNAILWGNAATTSGPQMANEYGSPRLYYSLVEGGCPSGATCNQPFLTVDPLFVAPVTASSAPTTTGDYRLGFRSPAIDAGDDTAVPGGVTTDLDGNPRIVGPTVDMGAYEWRLTVRYVDASATGANDGTSWYHAYTNLQDALGIATCGDEIWVAEGVYTPTNTAGPAATFALTNCVALYGGFSGYGGLSETLRSQRDWTAHVTVLSGDLDGNDAKNEDGVITDTANITGTNAYHVVTGSGVTGDAVLDGFTITGGNANGSDPENHGGGIYNDNSNPVLADVTFSSNLAAGNGGGIYNYFSSPTLTNTAFHGNSAAGNGGGMLNDNSAPALTNVLFGGNSATLSGGGMFNQLGSNPTLVNLTFSGNYAEEYGGGVYNSDSSLTVSNTILWGNTAVVSGPQMYNASSAPILDHSLVAGGCPSGAICDPPLLTDDPRFVAPVAASSAPTTAGNYRLQPTSPAIDAGDNTAVPSGVTADLDGNPRVVEPKVDMGAYETPYSSDIRGTVTSLGHCDVNPAPLEGADVLIESGAGISWTLQTDTSGSYVQGTHEVHSPLTVTVTHPEHETGIATGVLITAHVTTTVNLDLRWLVPCVDVEAPTLEAMFEWGMSTTLPVTVTNYGGGALDFMAREKEVGMIPLAPQAGSGPDAFGYVFRDNTELDGPEYNWVDISTTSTPVLLGDDNHDGPLPIGFTFNFYGTNWTEFYVGSNGYLSFGAGSNDPGNDCPLPNVNTPHNLIALMWDDLDPGDTSDAVYYQTFSSCPYGGGDCLVVQYENYHHYPGGGTIAGTFEAILFDNGSILIQFADAGSEQGSGSTTGIENGLGDDGLTYACNTAASLQDSMAVCFAYPGEDPSCAAADVPWLSEDPISGTVAADGGQAVIDVTLDAAYASQPGEHYATLNVVSNDPVNGRLGLPVTMTVNTPSDWGKLEGTVTSLGHCDADPAPLEGVEVFVESSLGTTWTLTTGDDGYYTVWMDESEGPVTVTVAPPEHEPGLASGVPLTSLMTTTVNFDLRWLAPCVSVAPDRLAATLGTGTSTTLSMSITNSGMLSTSFALVEGAPWLFEGPVTGTVAAGSAQAVDVTLDATHATPPGVYAATLVVNTDDPVSPSYGIPITMTVVCTEVTGINLFYTNTGTIYTDTLVHFVADVAPDDAAKPYSYTIDYDDGTAPITDSSGVDPLAFSHTFAATGTFDVETAIWNCGTIEPTTGTMRVVVTEYGVCVDLSSITIAGSTSGYPGVYTFTTSYEPIYASLPISRTWDDDGTGTVSVRTLGAGTHTLAVTATNCFALGTPALVTDTHQIKIAAYHIYLPSVLRNG